MEIMDLLYETEQTSMLFSSPHALSASILVAAYFFMVPKQQWEFPLLPWGFYYLDGYFQRQGLKEGDNRKILHIY
ncbi:cyclin-J18-like [Phalaenopsis equestris]|uniref:cyclin-J18-like n=1 Tax=Phalaenopsis equestris TaxID=78828 RepID=UPI0009E350D7|nr:cyclin-J18-like [Phalaenopsis equestris]